MILYFEHGKWHGKASTRISSARFSSKSLKEVMETLARYINTVEGTHGL